MNNQGVVTIGESFFYQIIQIIKGPHNQRSRNSNSIDNYYLSIPTLNLFDFSIFILFFSCLYFILVSLVLNHYYSFCFCRFLILYILLHMFFYYTICITSTANISSMFAFIPFLLPIVYVYLNAMIYSSKTMMM